MEVEIHCQGCGKLIRSPREAAGRWTTCPACGRQLYVPTPSAELEELPLAPEDTTFLQREAALQAERHRLDRMLNRERASPSSTEPRRHSSPEPTSERTDVSRAVVE